MRFLRLFQATYAQVVVVTMTTTVFQTVYGAPSVVVDQEPASLPADWTLVFPDTMLNSSTTRTGDNITYSFRSPNSVTKPFLGETSRAFDVDPTVTSSSITSSSVTSASGTTSTSPPLFFGPTLLLTDREHERYAPHDRGGMKLREEAETVTVEYPTFGHTVNQGITVTSMFTTEEATKTAVPIVEAPKEKEKEEEKEEGRFTKERKKIQKVLDALFGSGDEDDTGTGKEETEKKSLVLALERPGRHPRALLPTTPPLISIYLVMIRSHGPRSHMAPGRSMGQTRRLRCMSRRLPRYRCHPRRQLTRIWERQPQPLVPRHHQQRPVPPSQPIPATSTSKTRSMTL